MIKKLFSLTFFVGKILLVSGCAIEILKILSNAGGVEERFATTIRMFYAVQIGTITAFAWRLYTGLWRDRDFWVDDID